MGNCVANPTNPIQNSVNDDTDVDVNAKLIDNSNKRDNADYSQFIDHRLSMVQKLLDECKQEENNSTENTTEPEESYVNKDELIMIVSFWFREIFDKDTFAIDIISRNIICNQYEKQIPGGNLCGHNKQKQYEAKQLLKLQTIKYKNEYKAVLSDLKDELLSLKSNNNIQTKYWYCKEHQNKNIKKLCIQHKYGFIYLSCYYGGSVHHILYLDQDIQLLFIVVENVFGNILNGMIVKTEVINEDI
eukprot:420474_1